MPARTHYAYSTLVKKIGRERINTLIQAGLHPDEDGRFELAALQAALSAAGMLESDDPHERADTPGVVTRRQDVARHFEVTLKAVDYWVKSKTFPSPPNGPFDLAAIEKWRHDNRPGRPAAEISQSQAQLAFLKVEKAKLDLAERRGELVSVTTMANRVARSVGRQRAIVKAVPDKIVVRLKEAAVPAKTVQQIRAIVKESLDEMLRTMAADLEDVSQEEADEDVASRE